MSDADIASWGELTQGVRRWGNLKILQIFLRILSQIWHCKIPKIFFRILSQSRTLLSWWVSTFMKVRHHHLSQQVTKQQRAFSLIQWHLCQHIYFFPSLSTEGEVPQTNNWRLNYLIYFFIYKLLWHFSLLFFFTIKRTHIWITMDRLIDKLK